MEYPTDDMTYDDLVALATELKDKLPDGVYPFACPVDFQTWYYQTVYANGGWILNDDATETGYGDAKTQEGIPVLDRHDRCRSVTKCLYSV